MRWFVFEVSFEGQIKNYYVNARTEKSATKRLLYFRKRFKQFDGTIMLMNRDKPYQLLMECWHNFGMNGTVVVPE